MTIETDFSIDRATGNIRYTGSSVNHTVLAFYQWIRDLGDDQLATGDDLFDITDGDMATKAYDTIINLIGTANIDATAAQHLYGGSIIHADGTVYDGVTVLAPQGTEVDIVQNGSLTTNFWGTGLNADSANGVSHRFMLLVSNAGTDIDGRRILGQVREFGNEYNEFLINGSNRGENVLALATKADLNNETAIGAIAAIVDISNTEGYQGIDVNNDATDENYYSQWDRGANSINTFYEYVKWATRRGSVETLYGLSGELFRGITHKVAISGGEGTWVEPESLSWGSGATAGTGQLLAVDNTTSSSATVLYFQLLTGVIPSANTITGNGGATATAGTVTEQTVSKPFIGVSTGSSIIGAFGVGIEAADLSSSDKLTDLTDTLITPPNNQSGLVSNLISGDTVIIGPKDTGDAIKYDQLTLSGAMTAGDTTVDVTTTIPSDTPSTGTVRVFDGTNYIRVPYTGFSGTQFTGCTNTPNASNGANVFVSYIDTVTASTSENFGATYLSDRDMFCRVRNATAEIKTFESAVTFGSSGFALSAIRTSDA